MNDYTYQRPPFEAGNKVDASAWDGTEPPGKRLGICTVADVERGRCESGWMVTIISNRTAARMELDANWLQRVSTSD